jgi:hypothetical protein
MKFLITFIGAIIMSACSIFGESNVEIAPYEVLKSEPPYEVRHYESMVLVSAPMSSLDDQASPFGKLFDYISGDNSKSMDIPMTAPVFMDKNGEIMDMMSFVLPDDMDMSSAPFPANTSVTLEEITDYTVAVIQFNGRLKDDNINTHEDKLRAWIDDNQYKITGDAKTAGYNPPFTLPAFRRNEVLIPIEKPE